MLSAKSLFIITVIPNSMHYFIIAPDSIRNVNVLLKIFVWQIANGDYSNEIHHSRGEYSVQIPLLTYTEHSNLYVKE